MTTGLTSGLLSELSNLFRIEADGICQPYAWPPRAPLTAGEVNEVNRLTVTSWSISYLAALAAYEEAGA